MISHLVVLEVRAVLALGVLAASLGFGACSGDDEANSGDGDSGGGGASGCDESERTDGAICLGKVVGSVIDDQGDPVPDLPVTVCGAHCSRATTDAEGDFSVLVERFVRVAEYSVQAHGSPTASTFYHPIPTDQKDGDYDAGTLKVITLPDDGQLLITKLQLEGEISPEQTVTSGGVGMSIGEGTVVRLSVVDANEGDEGRRFRAQELSEDEASEFAPELTGARVFALGPFEAEMIGESESRPEVSFKVQNTEGWAAESEVEVLALGTYLAVDWLTPAAFEPIGTGVVSADGMTIDLPADAPGAGLRYLTWIALSPK